MHGTNTIIKQVVLHKNIHSTLIILLNTKGMTNLTKSDVCLFVWGAELRSTRLSSDSCPAITVVLICPLVGQPFSVLFRQTVSQPCDDVINNVQQNNTALANKESICILAVIVSAHPSRIIMQSKK